MAVGDFVVDIFAAAGVSTFIPAGTNVIMLTQWGNYVQTSQIYDGTNAAFLATSNTTNNQIMMKSSTKLFINNGHYLYFDASGGAKFYCGVQVA